MILYIIFGQRKEHPPEALEVIDERTNKENPGWLEEELRTYQSNKDMVLIKIIKVEISDKKLRNILHKEKK